MHPITGPAITSLTNQRGTFYKYRESYRQAKPYDLALPFRSQGARILQERGKTEGFWNAVGIGITCNPAWAMAGFPNHESSDGTKQFLALIESVRSIARERFNSKLRDQAEIGAALAQYQQSIDMIGNRAMQLYRFAKAMRRFDFVRAGRELNQAVYGKDGSYYVGTGRHKRPLNLRKNSRAAAANFLEYSFGWAPLVSDVVSAMNILDNPAKGTMNVRASARGAETLTRSNMWNILTTLNGMHAYSAHCTCSADVEVVNPNVSLAAQLGLVNPAAVGWEVVPFSFVIDYFVNVQSYLENFTSLFGLRLSNVWSTTYVKDKCDMSLVQTTGNLWCSVASDYYRVDRTNTLPDVSLRLKKFSLPIGRALTSVSLLVTLGIKK